MILMAVQGNMEYIRQPLISSCNSAPAAAPTLNTRSTILLWACPIFAHFPLLSHILTKASNPYCWSVPLSVRYIASIHSPTSMHVKQSSNVRMCGTQHMRRHLQTQRKSFENEMDKYDCIYGCDLFNVQEKITKVQLTNLKILV